MSKKEEKYMILADTIVMQAVRDYRQALIQLRKFPDSVKAMAARDSCERFFRSDWFCVLCTIDAAWLMDKLQEEYA